MRRGRHSGEMSAWREGDTVVRREGDTVVRRGIHSGKERETQW